jgi:hypothetical protein
MADGTGSGSNDASINAVAAHGMLHALTVAKGAVETVRQHWERLDPETRVRLLSRAEEHLAFLAESLGDLIRGIPSEAREFLDSLHTERD